jgi:hypothetical protein
MYICGDTNNIAQMEPETGYVPNNPLFGLPLESPQVKTFHLLKFGNSVSKEWCFKRHLLCKKKQNCNSH